MTSLPTGVSYLNGNYYTGGVPQLSTNNAFGGIASNINGMNTGYAMTRPDIFNKYFHMIGSAPTQQPQVQQTGASTQGALQNQYNRLAQQASNALNGGLLGYQPSQIQAAGSNPQTFNAPQGNFRNSFAGLQGLLGGGN